MRPRFSLTTLVLVTTIVAMGITVVTLWREVAPLRDEVERLRADAGVLDVGDQQLVHAIAGKTYQQKTFRWRVWCPAGKQVTVHIATHGIPVRGLTKPDGRLPLNRLNQEAAEVEVTLGPETTLDGQVRWNLHSDGATYHVRVPEDATDWLLKGATGWTGGPRHYTLVASPDEPLELMRNRAYYDKSGQVPPANPPELTDGLLVWLESDGAE